MLTKRFFKTKDEAEITFSFSRPGAKSVALVADFNGWKPEPMRYVKKDNEFKVKHKLETDKKYHFRYLVDGEYWDNDQSADEYLPNGFGSDNCVVSTSRA